MECLLINVSSLLLFFSLSFFFFLIFVCSTSFDFFSFVFSLKNPHKQLADSRWQCSVRLKWKKENREVRTRQEQSSSNLNERQFDT